MIVIAIGWIAPEPMPWIARKTISSSIDRANPHSVVPIRKIAVPIKNTRLPAVYVGEPPIERDRHRHRQKRDREHPAEQVKPAEMADDRRQRGRDDRAFDRRHEDRHQRRQQHQAAARHGDGRTRFLRHRLVQPGRPRLSEIGGRLRRSVAANNEDCSKRRSQRCAWHAHPCDARRCARRGRRVDSSKQEKRRCPME